MLSSDASELLGVEITRVSRLGYRTRIAEPLGSGNVHHWSPGDVLAMHIVNELDGPGASGVRPESLWAEGARACGEALDNQFEPAFLVTRGESEFVVVLESIDPPTTDEMVAALLLQALDAGAAVKVVRLRNFVAMLEPWCVELVDA